MICPRCGWDNPDDSRFCTRCGAVFETEEAPAEEKETSRRRIPRRAVFLAVAVILLVIGELLLNAGIRNRRYAGLISQAQEAVISEDWSAAGLAYNKALKIHPDRQELIDAIHELWLRVQLASADCCVSGRFEEAVEIARTLREIEPGNEIGNLSAMRSAYLSWVLELAETGNEQDSTRVVALASEDLPEDDVRDISDYAALLGEIASIKREIAQGLRPMLETAAGPDTVSIRAMDTVRAIISELRDRLEHYEELGGWFPVAVSDSYEGPAAGIWYDGYGGFQIYLGSMDADMVRQGSGENWFITDPDGEEENWEYVFCSGWKDDIPEGDFVRVRCSADGKVTRRMRGQLKAGRYDGEIETFWDDGRTYVLTFDEGIVRVLSETAPDGTPATVVGYTADGKNWIAISKEEAQMIYGIRYIY